jgi:hypothetical protein
MAKPVAVPAAAAAPAPAAKTPPVKRARHAHCRQASKNQTSNHRVISFFCGLSVSREDDYAHPPLRPLRQPG